MYPCCKISQNKEQRSCPEDSVGTGARVKGRQTQVGRESWEAAAANDTVVQAQG